MYKILFVCHGNISSGACKVNCGKTELSGVGGYRCYYGFTTNDRMKEIYV